MGKITFALKIISASSARRPATRLECGSEHIPFPLLQISIYVETLIGKSRTKASNEPPAEPTIDAVDEYLTAWLQSELRERIARRGQTLMSVILFKESARGAESERGPCCYFRN